MFKTLISTLPTRNATPRQSQRETTHQSSTMESMESRLLMASDYLHSAGSEPTTIGDTVTFTFTVSAPTTGILIGLLLPAVQKMPG